MDIESKTGQAGHPPSKTNQGDNEIKVRVALRIRPLLPKERLENSPVCIVSNTKTNVVQIGEGRTFVFDKVFHEDTRQGEVFTNCARELVLGCFDGYNATILAYGQTGSGKTFTMGSSAAYNLCDDDVGIIPRVIHEVFDEIAKRKVKAEFLIKVSFLEIYNEEINDLLDPAMVTARIGRIGQKSGTSISIREEKNGQIALYGITEEKVGSLEEMMACLEKGSLHRSTGSTLMNEASSRSHAIFTINIEQHQIGDIIDKEGQPPGTPANGDDSGFTTAKFHFVDLAGSERLKKTGATGAVMREGININRGLLALGNVIAALTDDSSKSQHIPYRESKLTRILQDSLGGNSRTCMIACVSPAECNFEESLNTLKYASRARNIKNKPIVNRDPHSALISQLKQQIFELQGEIMGYKRLLISNNIKTDDNKMMKLSIVSGSPGGLGAPTGYVTENPEEVRQLKIKVVQFEKQISVLEAELQNHKKQLNEAEIGLYTIQRERDLLRFNYDRAKKVLQDNKLDDQTAASMEEELKYKSAIEEYTAIIEKQKAEGNDKDKLYRELQIEYENLLKSSNEDHDLLVEKTKLIQELQKLVSKGDRQIQSLQKKLLNTQANQAGVSKIGGNAPLTASSNLLIMPENASAVTPFAADGDISIRGGAFAEGLDRAEFERQRKEEEDVNGDGCDEDEEEEDRIATEMEKEYEQNKRLTEKELHLVDGTLNEKEELMRSIRANQQLLERNLVDELKQQYHSKIKNMEVELRAIESQRDGALAKLDTMKDSAVNVTEKNKVIQTYKNKVQEMEFALKEFKKKDKDQQSLGRLVEDQKQKINLLDDEIKRYKQQRTTLVKRMKEDNDKFEKWKLCRQKEMLQMKKANVMKDQEIMKLKNEKRRQELYHKRRLEELLLKQRTHDILKYATPNAALRKKKQNQPTMRLNQSSASLNDSGTNLGASQFLSTKPIDLNEDHAEDLVDNVCSNLVKNVSVQEQIRKEEEEMENTEKDLEREKIKQSEVILRKDKLVMQRRDQILDEAEEEDYNTKLREIDMELQELNNLIETLEEKLEFKSRRINELTDYLKTLSTTNSSVEEIIFNGDKIAQNHTNLGLLLKIVFGRYVSARIEENGKDERLKQARLDIEELKSKFAELEQQSKMAEYQSQMNLARLTKEYEEKQLLLLKQQYYDDEAGDGMGIGDFIGEQENDKENLELKKNSSGVGSKSTLPRGPGGLSQLGGMLKEVGKDGRMSPLKNKERGFPEINAALNGSMTIANQMMGPVVPNLGGNTNNQRTLQKHYENIVDNNKRLEKTVSEYTKKQQLSLQENERLKRKLEVITQKYDQLKNQTAKDKFIGLTNKSNEHSVDAPHNHSTAAMTGAQSVPNISFLGELQGDAPPILKPVPPLASANPQKGGGPGFFKQQKTIGITSLKDKRREEKMKAKMTENVELTRQISSDVAENEEKSGRNSLAGPPAPRSSQLTTGLQQARLNKVLAKTHRESPQKERVSNSEAKGLNKSTRLLIEETKQAPSEQNASGSNSLQNDKDVYFMKNIEALNQIKALINPAPAGGEGNYAEDEMNLNVNYNNDKWKCVATLDQGQAVYGLSSYGNMLYSTTNRQFRVWSLDTLQVISDITAHSGFIKSITIWPEKNILATASEKLINLWDLVSLQNITTLKGHKDEIRALYVKDNLLFSAGKGGTSYGAMLVWDLRNLGSFEEREKNQDIFAMKARDQILYYGSRNHQVRRLDLSKMESLTPFEPPHFDTVTSLTIVNDCLVSGSRDKNLKLWNLNTSVQNLKYTAYAHQDWICALESEESSGICYSGARDGRIKAWSLEGEKLRCISDISSHQQSVNSIVKLDEMMKRMFASGSADRTIKLWKCTDDEIGAGPPPAAVKKSSVEEGNMSHHDMELEPSAEIPE